jgi:membrane fusion protein, copper/silver efflux system
MTFKRLLQRIVPPLVALAVTGAAFAGAAWIQSANGAAADAASSSDGIDHAAMGHGAHRLPDEESSFDRVPVPTDAQTLAAAGVQFEPVLRETVRDTVRAPAAVVPDESRISHVHTRVSGWIEELRVNVTGERVTAGQVVARIFSQELLASQTEYLMARRHAEDGVVSAVVESGRARLRVLGMSVDDIAALERAGEPMPLVAVRAPHGGIVVNRGVTVGTSVDPSTELLTIADLSRVWVIAEVPEMNIAALKVGTRAAMTFPALGSDPLTGRVEFLAPLLTEQTRTLAVRIALANPRGTLRPGLYGDATFDTAPREALTISREALVDTGDWQHVFVECHGRVLPREVRVGATLGSRVEVLRGLMEGERVVSAGVFLLDSESRLRATGIDVHAGH